MFRQMTIRSKLVAILLLVGFFSIGIIGWQSYKTGKEALNETFFNQLTSIRAIKTRQIEDYFDTIRKQVSTFSEDRMIVEAMKELKGAFHSVIRESSVRPSQITSYGEKVQGYYRNEYLTRLQPNVTEKKSVNQYWSDEAVTSYLQYHYLANNPNDTGEKDNLDRANDGSRYSQLHAIYHPIIRRFLKEFGYYDIFLVDDETGHIIYSVFKEVDYSTSLLTGPYSSTNFGQLFQATRNANDKDFVKLVDFESYDPSYAAPASFIASPIFDGNKRIGVLMFQMPVDKINQVMTGNHNWVNEGLGESGETYIVGKDRRMRSVSRFLIEDRKGYFKALQKIGTPEQTIATINNLNTSILLQTVQTDGVDSAFQSGEGTDIIDDYRGIPVLSAYTKLKIKDVDWVMLSEVDEAEAFASVDQLSRNILIAGCLILLVEVIFAFGITKLVTVPISRLVVATKEFAEGKSGVSVEVDSEDEFGELATAFNSMISTIYGMIDSMQKDREQLTSRTEQLSLSAEEIIAGMVIFAEGNTETHLSCADDNELAALYAGFNAMVDTVRKTSATLETERSGVEEQRLHLSSKVGEMLEAMEKFADGDLTVRLAADSDSEIGKLFDGFNRAVTNITGMMTQVLSGVTETASTATKISSSTEEIAVGARQQSSQTDDVAGAVEEMNQTILETSRMATKTAEFAGNSGDVARDGEKIVRQTVDKMREIAEVVRRSSETVEKLGDSSNEIGEIISVINDIADQTNLLALNAAIEAARAGDQGRGFAVVADEVRKLAERTTQATKKIANMIKAIQGETGEAVTAMKLGNDEVREGIKLADGAGEALSRIVKNTQEVLDYVNQIASAGEEQSATSEEIAKNVDAISSLLSDSAKNLSQIAGAAEGLDKLTNDLQGLMNTFNIGSSHSGEHFKALSS